MPNRIEISDGTDEVDCFVGARVTNPLYYPDNVISTCMQCFHLIQHRPDVPSHLKMVCLECHLPEARKASLAGELTIRTSPRHRDEYLQWLEDHKTKVTEMATHTNVKIVKVQLPLATDKTLCFVSDRQRKHPTEQPIPQSARDAMKGDARAFFEASFIDGRWNIYKRVPEQFW